MFITDITRADRRTYLNTPWYTKPDADHGHIHIYTSWGLQSFFLSVVKVLTKRIYLSPFRDGYENVCYPVLLYPLPCLYKKQKLMQTTGRYCLSDCL